MLGGGVEVGQLRQTMDTKIKSSIQALRHRNTLAPVSSLPPEVIAAIFSFLRLPAASLLGGRPEHVCHQWREIALHEPLLWSRIDFTDLSLAGTAEILARAKRVPLHLEARFDRFQWNKERFSAFEKLLLPHVSHICHLNLSSDTFYLCKIVGGFTSSPAPTLEHFSLSHDGPFQVYIPDTLFDSTTPRLSSLELRNCSISWRSPLLNGLKYLEIRTPNVRPRLADWLDALNEMPQLERLVLHSASPIAPPFPFDIRRTVTLPFLTHLDISGLVRDCAFALAHLVLPVITWLCLAASSDSSDGKDVPELIPYVARHAHGPQDIQPLQSMLIFGERMRTHILAWPGPDVNVKVYNPATLRRAALTARLSLSIEHYKNVLHFETFLEAAMATLPLNSLVRFAVRRRRLDEYFWRDAAPRWPLLQRVRLGFLATRGFTEMLLRHKKDWRECPLLPSLTRLDLTDGIELDEREAFRLCDALMMRVEQGVPLETLDLRRCLTLDVRILREIVVDVLATLWDADYSDYSDDDGNGNWYANDDGEDDEDEDEDEDEEWQRLWDDGNDDDDDDDEKGGEEEEEEG